MRTLNEVKEKLKQLKEEVKRYEEIGDWEILEVKEIEVKMLEWVLDIK